MRVDRIARRRRFARAGSTASMSVPPCPATARARASCTTPSTDTTSPPSTRTPLQPVGDRLDREALARRLPGRGRARGPAVVAAEGDQRRPGDAREVEPRVEVPAAGRAFAEEDERGRGHLLQAGGPREADGVGDVGADERRDARDAGGLPARGTRARCGRCRRRARCRGPGGRRRRAASRARGPRRTRASSGRSSLRRAWPRPRRRSRPPPRWRSRGWRCRRSAGGATRRSSRARASTMCS